MSGLGSWLTRHGLDDRLPVLEENDIDLGLLSELTEDDLREMAFTIGQRRRFFRALAEDPPGGDPQAGALSPDRDEAMPAPVPGQAPPAGETVAERRQMTVMFCDLVGSTELAARLDPETMSDLLQRYAAEASRAIVGQGGHVAKFLGDGVMAYFGWPRANEDAAARAVRAGLEVASRVAAIDGPRGALAARVGIATGPVVVSEMRGEGTSEQGSIAGPTPNLAARLEGCAAPGEVIIQDVTRRLVGALFELEPRGEAELKGFETPVPVWRVLAPARGALRFEARSAAGLTDFVGRESEARLLAERWERAQSGDGQVVLLSGEAGIGKSRILRELRRSVRHDGDVALVQIQCAPDEVDTAFAPFARELAAAAGISAGDAAEARLAHLDRHLRDVFPDPGEARALLGAVLGLPAADHRSSEMTPQRRQLATISHLAERIRRLSERRPALVLVEDLHWADASSLATLDALVSSLDDAAMLVVATTRPGPTPPWVNTGNATFYSLNRLSRGSVEEIARSAAGGKALPDDVLQAIQARTDGVPLFVEELTKAIIEAGLLTEEADRFVLDAPLPPLAIPATLQDSLMARIDRMAPVKQVLQAAAAIGREFAPDLLTEIVDQAAAALDDALAQLVEAELIFRRSDAKGERFVFKHALVQDTAYGSLLSGPRKLLHGRIASALERRGAVEPAVLARHCLEAGEARRAAELYVEAGQGLMARSALDEAIGVFEKGLAAVQRIDGGEARDRLELDARIGLGTTRMARFGWAHPSVAEALEPAFALAEGVGDSDALCPLLWGLWVHYQTRAEFPRAWHWLGKLEQHASPAPGSELAIVNDMSVGCQHFWEADYAKALFHTDRLAARYDHARHGKLALVTNHDPLVFSHHWAGSLAEWISGNPDRSVERLDEAVALARQIGHPFNHVFALTAGASALYFLGRAQDLLACADEAADVAAREALGPFSELVLVTQWRGAARLAAGDAEEAWRLVSAGNAVWTESGGRICTAMFRSWLVEALIALDRHGEAWSLNEANIAHCRSTGDRFMEPDCLRLRGDLVVARGAEPSAAEAVYRDALSTAEAHGARSWALRAATALADVLRREDARAGALAVLEPAIEAIEGKGGGRDMERARRLLAEIG